MTAVITIHDRRRWVVAHAAGAEQMYAAVRDMVRESPDFFSAGGVE